MSVLTRIKNNQITDSTIFANTKIAAGSIVGSLFNANLTMTSDVTITGNLTVQGSSTYLTVASTNTYVNDPLIVLNNAFSGTNTNDIGLLFNRGSDTNQAFIWDESEDEFRLIATSETGTTYGAVTTSSYANVRVGNLNVEGAAAFGSLSTTGDIGAGNLTLSGDAAVNGGDLTTTATTFNLVNSNATTVNFAGDATTLIVGSTTGTANIRNATINLIGNATVGGTLDVTGHVTLEGVTSTGATGTGNLVFSTSPALTTPNIGTPSFANLTNATELPISTGVSGLATGVADFLVTPSSSNLISAVTDETGTGNLVFSASPVLTTPNIGTPSFANLTNAVALPVTSLTGLATGIADFLATPSSSNLISAVTDETGTGNLVFSTSPTLETSLATTSTNFDLLNTSATTVNAFGAATLLTIGDTSGTLTVRNALLDVDGNATVGGTLGVTGDTTLTGDLAVNGGDLTTSASTFNLVDANATTVNFAGAATTIDLGATSGTLTINNPTVVGTQTTQDLYNTAATTLNFAGAATTLTVGATTGVANIRNATTNVIGNATVGGTLGVTGNTTVGGTLGITGDSTLTGNLAVNGGDLTTTATTFNLLDATATTVNAFGAATAIELGATTGTLTLNNPTVVGTQTTQNLYNTTATTLNIGGAATALNLGAATGNTTVQNNLITTGNINLDATTPSTDTASGALIVAGGAGIGGNLFVGGNATIAGNLTVTGNITFTNENNLAVSDAIIELHYPEGGVFTENDGHDVGLRFHWYDGSNDNSFLGRANDTGYLEWYGTGVTEDPNVAVISGEYGTMKLGNILLAGNGVVTSTSTSTGAIILENERGIGVGGNIWFGGSTLGAGASTVDLINTTATTVNFAGAATALAIGATTGTLTVNNPTVVGTQSTQDLYNTTATTLNFAGAATTLTIGAATGTTNIRNALVDIDGNATVGGTLGVTGDTTLTGDIAVNGGDITTTASTATVFNTNATTVDAFKAATDLEFGATSGTLTINNPTVVGTQSTQDLYNTTATTLNFAGAATTLIVGATSGVANIRNSTTNILGNATVGGTLGVTGDATLTGDIAVNGGDITTTATTATVFNTNATTVSAFGAATTLNIGASTGTLTLNNATVTTPGQIISTRAGSAVDGNGQIFLNGSTSNRIDWNTNGTGAPAFTTRTAGTKVVLYPALSGSTVDYAIGIDSATMWSSVPENGDSFNFKWYGAETLIANLSGTGNFTTVGDVAVNGGDLTTTAATFNLVDANATTVNFAGAATSLVAGATSGTFSLRNANLHLPNATTIHSSQPTVAVLNENVTTVNGFGDATALTLGATTGTATIRNATVSLPNATNIHVSQSSVTFANTNATTVNAFGAATELNLAAVGGNTTIRGNVVSSGILVAAANLPTTQPTTDPSDGTTSLWVAGGSVLRGNVFITEEANISYANIYSNTISTSSSTGALVVTGGVGLKSNLNVSGGTVINIDQTAQPFQVKGQFATTLIYADSVTDTVTIGGSNTTPVSGATLRVNGTGALILPVGTTGQRPGSSGNVDVRGMLRINSSLNILEYYDGSAWQSSQGSFTVISNDSFSGNGIATVFTMGGGATTASTIVSINGIVQIPATSYSISDDVLTFTEAPEVGDIIDVRRLTTTVSVDELGFNQNVFKANIDYSYISTGTVSSTPRLLIDTDGLVTVTGDMEIYGNLTVRGNSDGQINIGDSNADNLAITAELNSNIVPNLDNTYDLGAPLQRWRKVYSYATVHDQTATNVSANATPTLVDTFVTSDYSSAKYLVQIKAGSTVQAAELLLVQDTANAYITTYGVLSSNVELGTFTANIASGNVNLYYTSTTATNSNVKVHTTYIV